MSEKQQALAHLRKLNEMLGGEAWKLLDSHWELQEKHNQLQALNLTISQENRAIALGAYHAIKAMRSYPKQLGMSLQSNVEQDLQSNQ